jgi:hypothetical protein
MKRIWRGRVRDRVWKAFIALDGAAVPTGELVRRTWPRRIEGNGVRTIIVETASRFTRDLMVQEVGHAKLRERGIDLVAADNPGSFLDDADGQARAPGARGHQRVRQGDDGCQASRRP